MATIENDEFLLDLVRDEPTIEPKRKRRSPTADKAYIWCEKCWLRHPVGVCDRD